MRHEHQTWDNLRITWEKVLGGVGQTGLSPTVAIERISDSKWWNGATWQVGFTSVAMTERHAVRHPGLYENDFSAGAHITLGTDGYIATVTETTTSSLENFMIHPTDPKNDAGYIWDEPAASHLTAGTFGAILNSSTGLTQGQVAQAVWDALEEDHRVVGSFGRAIQIGIGLMKRNYEIRNPIYDSEKRLIECEFVLYPTAADALAKTNELAVINVASDYDDDGNMETFIAVED